MNVQQAAPLRPFMHVHVLTYKYTKLYIISTRRSSVCARARYLSRYRLTFEVRVIVANFIAFCLTEISTESVCQSAAFHCVSCDGPATIFPRTRMHIWDLPCIHPRT